MTLPQKAAVSFLITAAPFAALAFFAYAGLFGFIETRFYAPSALAALSRETEKDARVIESYLFYLERAFFSSLSQPSSRRDLVSGSGGPAINGLKSVRFVNAEGGDLFYESEKPVIPGPASEIFTDGGAGLVIFSFPLYALHDGGGRVGWAVFSLSDNALRERLLAEGRIRVGQGISLTGDPAGIVSGSPARYRKAVLSEVSSIWAANFFGIASFDFAHGPLGAPAELNRNFTLASAVTSQGVLYGRVINSDAFVFPASLRAILLACAFLSIYLAVFLLLNLKRAPQPSIEGRKGDNIKTRIKHSAEASDLPPPPKEPPPAKTAPPSAAQSAAQSAFAFADAPPRRGLLARCLESRMAIKGRDGIHVINSSLLENDGFEAEVEINGDFKILVESVLRKMDYSIGTVKKNNRIEAVPKLD